MNTADLLKECRGRIDALDARILALLNERAGIALEIGRIKAGAGLPTLEASREKAVVDGMVAANQGPLPPDAVERVYTAIMAEMRLLQDVSR
jgi:chorismate mutase